MNDKKDTSIPPGNRPFWPRGKPLTRQQIWAIKASPLKPADIALEYGITYWRAWSYQSGRRGKGVASPVKVLRYRFARSKNPLLTLLIEQRRLWRECELEMARRARLGRAADA